MKFTNRNQSGFTLVEIAIVLVIIGLLLGGVLKGQQMIENSRIKAFVTAFNGVSSAYNSYQDRYQEIPGDELVATANARGWNTLGLTVGGNGDGTLEATPGNTFVDAVVVGTDEEEPMWQALRAAGFLSGDPGAVGVAALPVTPTGGLIGVAQNVYAMGGLAVCASALTTNQASGVDTLVDGNTNAVNGNLIGSARGTTSAAAPPLAPTAAVPVTLAYNVSVTTTLWTMCKTL